MTKKHKKRKTKTINIIFQYQRSSEINSLLVALLNQLRYVTVQNCTKIWPVYFYLHAICWKRQRQSSNVTEIYHHHNTYSYQVTAIFNSNFLLSWL